MISVRVERWPIVGRFVISRGSKSEAEVVVVTVERGGRVGRAEVVPYARYGETTDRVLAAIEGVPHDVEQGALAEMLPPGAARSALDCALWDLAAKRSGRRVWDLLGLPEPPAVTTARTLSVDTPDAMARAAGRHGGAAVLKVKVDAEAPLERIGAVRAVAPGARLIVDANEAWSVEQPVAAGRDEGLAGLALPVALCADESCHTRADLERIRDRYDAVNVKLDKAGGLTEALGLVRAAHDAGLRVMLGCMVSTSLAVAPAMVLAGLADFVDLDGPLLLARDREPGLRFEGSVVHPPLASLWG